MIIPPRFYYEIQHPILGDKVHFVIRHLPKREATAAGFSTDNHHIALMTNLYVHPIHRGTGVGKELLKMLRQWQDKTKTDVVFLVSPYPRNPPLDIWCLKNFYTSHGFPEIPSTKYHGRIHQNKRRKT